MYYVGGKCEVFKCNSNRSKVLNLNLVTTITKHVLTELYIICNLDTLPDTPKAHVGDSGRHKSLPEHRLYSETQSVEVCR